MLIKITDMVKGKDSYLVPDISYLFVEYEKWDNVITYSLILNIFQL